MTWLRDSNTHLNKSEQYNSKSDQERLVMCEHTVSQGREGEKGSWCLACGIKVLEVDDRECKNCKHFFKSADYTGCRKHLMAVTPNMNVTYKLSEGTCFQDT